MKDLLPEPAYDAIREHLSQRAREAAAGWEGGSDEEDTLTGDLGATLRTDWSQLPPADGYLWRWRVRYKKFRGRGQGAFEKTSGADGILQIEITRGSEKHFKGVLFQAKKVGRLNGDLASQLERMEQLAPGGSAVIEYGPTTYRAAPGKDYLQGHATSHEQRDAGFRPLSEFLGDSFLPCASGLRGMYYDAVRELLVLPSGVAHHISVRHRITVETERIS
ncbi:MAG: hypothetical protein A3F90_12970 [Deltaproteobacteria bacterium RIFCSPLOWO2_12_FULL_60_19]|nr:MAG: hypothetical protein A3F90_12970 [Deltaproteobacteria bacterium RIFCSPLOWO2_12_FULL_60_19]